MPVSATSRSSTPTVVAVIPAYNEERSVGLVLDDIPRDLIHHIVVVNNRSSDSTAQVAARHGAIVLDEHQRGYGAACLRGIEHAYALGANVIVFLDADYSDHPEEASLLLAKILDDGYDMVIGSRATGNREPGSMTPQALFGNRLATTLIRWIWRTHYTDLGPFRAITTEALRSLDMQDTTWGWTVEMQIKAARQGLRITEVPVSYRRRIGTSKISGTVSGTIKAGWKILFTIGRYWLTGRRR